MKLLSVVTPKGVGAVCLNGGSLKGGLDVHFPNRPPERFAWGQFAFTKQIDVLPGTATWADAKEFASQARGWLEASLKNGFFDH